jgi:nucleotide-binding universal stress UspA family protein
MKILHPTDFSDSADQAEKAAVQLAQGLGGEIILLHVTVDTPLYGEGLMNRKEVREVYEATRKWVASELEARVSAIRQQQLAARFVVKTGAPHEEIVKTAAAEDVDYIVIGTRGRAGIERALLGSVADRVIRTAPCPVVSVRQSED